MTKGEQTKLRLIETASDLFWEYGFRGVSVSQIANGANVNKATLYQYFGSKEELALEVVAHQRQWTIEKVFQKAFEEESGAQERLRLIYKCITDNHSEVQKQFGAERGCPFVNMAMELATVNQTVRNAVQHTFKEFAVYYRKIVEDLSPNSRTEKERTLAVDALIRNMHGAMVASKIEQNPAVVMEAFPVALVLARGK